MMSLRFKARERSEKGYLMDCVFPCRVWFRFLRDELAKRVLEYFYENTDVLIYDAVFKVGSLRFKSESYEELCKGVSEPVESFWLYLIKFLYLVKLNKSNSIIYLL